MKIFLMSGAYRNAGDFLIVDRSIKLLKYVYPDCEIVMHQRKYPLNDVLDEVNTCDFLLFAGGPMYKTNICPDEIPMIDDLGKIKIPIYSIGLGWYGKNQCGKLTFDDVIYNKYRFNNETNTLLNRMERDGVLTCRDFQSVRVLKNNGFKKVTLTGCPAWYDLNFIDKNDVKETMNFPYKKICISEPGYQINMEQSVKLTRHLVERYPMADIYYVFHKGIYLNEDIFRERAHIINQVMKELKQMGVKIIGIPYSVDGFHLYDDCDLHIGYRVHAHIYNLSRRNVSVLIEEDGRGNAFNEIAGLYGIEPYHLQMNRKLDYEWNPYFLQVIDDYLDILESNDFMQMKVAYRVMQDYFPKMIKRIEDMGK